MEIIPDLLITLGGESLEPMINGKKNPAYRSRSRTTICTWRNAFEERPLDVIALGHHSGVYKCDPRAIERELMMRYFLENEIPYHLIHVEEPLEEIKKDGEVAEGSFDTLTNFIYAQPIIEKIDRKLRKERRKVGLIGIITDDYMMDRGIWTAQRVLGKYEFTPIATGITDGVARTIQEQVIKAGVSYDLRGIKPGDREAFVRFVNEKHPMYNSNAPMTATKALIELKKRMEK
jgi:hypothetical protein